MFAITATGWRTIEHAGQLQPGETAVEEIPQSLLDSISASAATKAQNLATIRQQAELALVELRAFRDLASPTNAQTLAVVKVLCRVAIGLIRLQLNKLDGDS